MLDHFSTIGHGDSETEHSHTGCTHDHAPRVEQQDDYLYGCPCCAPFMSSLSALNYATTPDLDKPDVWRRKVTRSLVDAPTGTTVFINAKIMTMDAAGTRAEAIAVKGDKIVAVGNKDEVLAQAGTDATVVSADGRTILPGFIEPHFHLSPIAMMNEFEDVSAFRFDTIDEVLDHLETLAQKTPVGEWIMGRQLDPSLQEGPDEVTRDMLDRVSTDHPIYLFNASLHLGYCNSAALEVAGITKDTPDLPNSPYGRFDDGTPNGVLKGGAAMFSVALRSPKMASSNFQDNVAKVFEHANSIGITTFVDQAMGAFQGPSEVDAYHAFAETDAMTVRLRYSLADMMADAWDQKRPDINFGYGNEKCRATGWKIVSDGSNQGRTGLQREAYLGREDKGVAYVDPDDLIEKAVKRGQKGWQVVIHANGNQAIDNTLAAMQAAQDAGVDVANLRFRIEHCSVLHDEHIDQIAELGISPSFLIGHIHYWAKTFRDNIFGEEKANRLGRAKSCQDKGINWTVHSDDPVSLMGPMRLVHNAVTRSVWKEEGSVLNPAERVDVETALRAVTSTAAWQCHSDHEVGSLETGKFADFVILDSDPMTVAPEDLQQVKVLETWMGGRQVYQA